MFAPCYIIRYSETQKFGFVSLTNKGASNFQLLCLLSPMNKKCDFLAESRNKLVKQINFLKEKIGKKLSSGSITVADPIEKLCW